MERVLSLGSPCKKGVCTVTPVLCLLPLRSLNQPPAHSCCCFRFFSVPFAEGAAQTQSCFSKVVEDREHVEEREASNLEDVEDSEASNLGSLLSIMVRAGQAERSTVRAAPV